MTPERLSPPPVRRNWFSFRLRTLLILGPLASIALAWGFRYWYPNYLEGRAVREVTRLAGSVVRNEQHEVVAVELPGKEINDARLAELVPYLTGLPKLKRLVLVSNDITDEGLQHLVRLPQLESVELAGTQVTPDGIAALNRQLPSLTIDMTPPHVKATKLAARNIYPHATVAITISPQGHVVGGSGDGQVRIWDPRAASDGRGSESMLAAFRAHTDWTFAVAFHPRRNWLATGGGDGLIKLWDFSMREEIARFVGHDDDVHAIRFTPDGNTLVSASDDWTVRVWNVPTRRERFVLQGHSGTIPGLDVSRDGKLIASASRDGTIRLWHLERGELIGVLEGHGDDVMAVAFHPTQPWLASASYDRTVRVWDLVTRNTIATYGGHQDWVFSVAWSPDGKQLASAAGDGVRLWDSGTGKPLWHSRQQRDVSNLAWLNSTRVAASSADSSVSILTSSGQSITTLWPRFSDTALIPLGLPLPLAVSPNATNPAPSRRTPVRNSKVAQADQS